MQNLRRTLRRNRMKNGVGRMKFRLEGYRNNKTEYIWLFDGIHYVI